MIKKLEISKKTLESFKNDELCSSVFVNKYVKRNDQDVIEEFTLNNGEMNE